MIHTQVFGVLNCGNKAFLEAANLDELILKLCEEFKLADPTILRSCAVIVNNEYVMNPDRRETELKDGDDVLFLAPMIGG